LVIDLTFRPGKDRSVETWDWAADGLAEDKPNVARMYDYFLGGEHNFPADREMADKAIAIYPGLTEVAKINRAFLRRAVRYLCVKGIRQFIDIGSGLPTLGNVHEVAQEVAPDAKVVYCDIDQTAVTYCRMMLIGNPDATVVHGDVRHVEQILAHRDLRHLIDLGQPVAVLVLGLLHFFVDDDHPETFIARIFDTVAPGSYLAISHASSDLRPEDGERITKLYERSGNPIRFRTHAEIAKLFGGFTLVEPGLVEIPDWRPSADVGVIPEAVVSGYAGVGHRP
jgi:hypothetical protein